VREGRDLTTEITKSTKGESRGASRKGAKDAKGKSRSKIPPITPGFFGITDKLGTLFLSFREDPPIPCIRLQI
jgi:hypothetical protein